MKITLAVDESKKVSVAGSQFYLINAAERIRVKKMDGGDSRTYDLAAGMGFKLNDGQHFPSVELTNLGASAQTVEFEISDTSVFDNRAVGVVSVVNSDKSRTDLDGAYMLTGNRTQSPAVYSCVNLRNPVGSQKNIYVNQVVVSVAQVSDCIVFVTPTIEADQLLSGVSSVALGGVGSAICKKVKVGSSGGNGRVDQFYSDAFPKGNMRGVARTYISANGSFIFKFTEPVRLEPGAGMVVANFTVNQAVSASFEFFEEVIS